MNVADHITGAAAFRTEVVKILDSFMIEPQRTEAEVVLISRIIREVKWPVTLVTAIGHLRTADAEYEVES